MNESAEATYRPPKPSPDDDVELTTLHDDWGATPPPWIIRRDDSDGTGRLVSEGEVAILTGAGGLGKSIVVLSLIAASGKEPGRSCGLELRQGPVVLVSYEDNPIWLAIRLQWYVDKAPEHVYVWLDPDPLYRGGDDAGVCPRWDVLWAKVRDLGATLVVIDPASAALLDVDTSQTGPVRDFIRQLAREATAAKCGVLVIAHSTKQARNLERTGDDPGAGVVSGSAAWYDGVRGVLSLSKNASDEIYLRCAKANYGRPGWVIPLQERTDPRSGRFHGFEVATQQNPDNDNMVVEVAR